MAYTESMSEAKYDSAASFYQTFVENALSSDTSAFTVISNQTIDALGNVSDLRVCDVACGQGHLSRRLAGQGAFVTGVDLSKVLLAEALNQNSKTIKVNYLHDDAQNLATLESESFDFAVCNMALMDIPDHKAVFDSCQRILKAKGIFVFSILHPCFESPFNPENPPIELDESGDFKACRVHAYLEEGYWSSGGNGVRGKVGAHHRTLSTYLNDLICSGFELKAIHEPALAKKNYSAMEDQWFSKIPKGLVIRASKA